MNPASGESLTPDFAEATKEQTDAAVCASSEAFDATLDSADPRWPAMLLDRVAANIMDLGEALLERGEAETALPKARLTGERARTVNQLKMFAEFVREGSWVDATIDTADPKRQPLPKPDVRRMLRPRGPVVVFGASNFPFAFSTLGGDTASALAGGNPVIVKGHPSHPGTSEMFAIAILAALESLDLPRGLFGLLQGRSHELSAWLVQHPNVTAVGFTGSQKAGRALFDLAAARPRPIPVYAEMGSLNPLILTSQAIDERGDGIAKDLAGSILLGGGQFCTKPGLVLLPAGASSFVESLAKHVSATASVTMLNQGLRDSFLSRVNEWSHVPGVKRLGASNPSGYASVSPSIFTTTTEIFLRETRLREEAFGPAALLVEYRSENDVRLILESTGGSLTGTIHAGSTGNATRLIRALESVCGRVIVNGYPTGVEVTHAMVHGGPYPATTDPNSTSVGTAAIKRFVRMVSYQNVPDGMLPPALENSNPLQISRIVNGRRSSDPI